MPAIYNYLNEALENDFCFKNLIYRHNITIKPIPLKGNFSDCM